MIFQHEVYILSMMCQHVEHNISLIMFLHFDCRCICAYEQSKSFILVTQSCSLWDSIFAFEPL